MRNGERTLAVVAMVTVVAAWVVGWYRHDTDLGPFLKQALPTADRFEQCGPDIFAGKSERPIVGYVAIGEADGYGGPMRVAVGIDPEGTVVGVAVVEHHETAAYFLRVSGADLPESLLGKSYSDPFLPGEDVDAVTGATKTVTALAQSVSEGTRSAAGGPLELPLPPKEIAPIEFGLPEVTLLALFGVLLAGSPTTRKRRRLLHWLCLLTGLLVLGFLFNRPLTLTNVNSLLIGYWPQWQSHVYWYLLIAGVLLVPLVTGKNPYCIAICPFGATQRCLGVIGGAKPRRLSSRLRARLRWMPRLLAWAAILLALIYRNPALASYEVYGTLFDLIGTHFQFGLLAVVLILSLFVTRPWCNYLCPIRAVTDYVRHVRKWTLSLHVRRL